MTIAAPPLSLSLDGREFQTVGDSAGSPKSGGYENEFVPNGNPATGRTIMTPTPWRLPDQGIEVDLSSDDREYLIAKKNNAVQMDCVLVYRDATLGGTGVLEGELNFDPMTSTVSVTLAGSGELEKL